MAASGDPCFNRSTPGRCTGTPDVNYYNLEVHSRVDNPDLFRWGDAVEGRVAGALWDLFDNSPGENYDRASYSFGSIAELALGNNLHPLAMFWYFLDITYPEDHLQNGFAFWWNTINYVDIQQNFLPLVIK
jgi:hypothetical protein